MNRLKNTVMTFLWAMVVTMAFALSPAVAQAADNSPLLLSLESDAASYVVGDRALLSAHVLAQPTSGRFQWHLEARLAGAPQQITRLSDEESVVLTGPFETSGDKIWRIELYLQDKDVARSLESTMAYYRQENIRLADRLSRETNPERRAQILATIDRNNGIIALTSVELTGHRRLIDVKELTIMVAATAVTAVTTTTQSAAADEPVLRITTDREDATYAVGAAASFFVEVLTSFTGLDGPQETVVTGALEGAPLAALSVDDAHYTFTTDVFEAANVGSRTFQASLSIRSKARADALRRAITGAENRRDEIVAALAATQDPALQALYIADLEDMSWVIDRLYAQLDALATPVATQSVVITVVP